MKFVDFLNEVKVGRGSQKKLANLDKLINWLYKEGVLIDSDKERKDDIYNDYNRYYNDGDVPESLSRFDIEFDKEEIEERLEQQLESFIKEMLWKYKGDYDKKDFNLS